MNKRNCHLIDSLQRVHVAAWVVITAVCLMPFSASGQHRVVAYYPGWMKSKLPANRVKFEYITHINHAFAWPLANGSITGYSEINHPELIAETHKAGKKILISLGGWGQSGGFAPVAADSTVRKKFVKNLVDYCLARGYDGADFDWEFPQNAMERANFTTLIKETYHAGHNAPLYAPANDDGSGHQGIQYLRNQRGIPKEKIHLGMPFYGKECSASQLYGPATSWSDLEYSTAMSRLKSGWNYFWDEVSKVPYLLNASRTRFVTFEDSLSLSLKCEYAKTNGLGGVMIWALGQDVMNNVQPLLEAVGRAMLQTTAIAGEKAAVAKNFVLFDNYPNPFKAATTVAFQLEREMPVKLSVYSLTGDLVAVLRNGAASAGKSTVVWDATNYSSGVYFFKLETTSFSATKKMILAK